ncbi:fimbrial protein [Serratia aquatilis]|uniref:Fimbrial protein n=1 Tax=Serratia aquatilis TaxID=1737515 RepID=A0ABV6EB97_9GAMM
MNKKLIAIAVLATSALTSGVFAAPGGDGTVRFTGEIIPQGCEVSADTKDQIVNLKKIAATAFPQSGATAGDKDFSIILTNCPTTVSTASVRFSGTQVPGNNAILALTTEPGVATGVGIQISDSNNRVINLFQDSTPANLVSGSVENELKFVASYVSTADIVNPGVANAVSNFTIAYQ